jgi:hypothetical protein
MSFDAIKWSWTVPDLTPTQRLILLAVCNMADDKNRQCWASQNYLAKATGLTDRSIRTALKTLESRKLLSRKHRTKATGSRTSDLITVHWPAKSAQPRVSQTSDDESAGVALPDLEEAISATSRNEIPEPPGITFRESNQEEPTRQNQEDNTWDNDLWLEKIPEPDDLSAEIHNRAAALFEAIRGSLAGSVDHNSPGIKSTAILKDWVARFDIEFVAEQILAVVARRKGPQDPIRSWRYFAAEIERAAKENSTAAGNCSDESAGDG